MKSGIKIAFILSCITVTVFAQKDEKQLSLDFIERLKNAQYQEAYTMFDSVIMKKLTEDVFKNSMEAAIKQLGPIGAYTFVDEKKGKDRTVTYTECKFKNSTLDIELSFTRDLSINGFHFVDPMQLMAGKYLPPKYDSLNCYTEKNIIVTTGKYKMQGVLTMPNGVKNPPVVIMVQGSGPNDMDETIGPNKPFKDMAVGLARYGIATIRYDKRSHVYGSHMADDLHNATVKDEVIEDVISAVNMVGLLGCDTDRIYMLGHSLGAMLAPRIATQCKKIKGIVMMAGDSRSMEDVMLEQVNYLASLDTAKGSNNKEKLAYAIKQIEFAKSPDLKPDAPDSLLPMGVAAPYWIDINHYNQVKTAEELRIPIYILQGERDYQVTMEDYSLWKEKLGKKKNVAFKSYPKLNHLFIEGTGKKSTPDEYKNPGHVPLYVISDIATWVNKNGKL